MKLKDHIRANHDGVKAEFARSEGVLDQQITKWINAEYIVVGGVMYSPRRVLKGSSEKQLGAWLSSGDLKLICEKLDDINDSGPYNEGWRSEELIYITNKIELLVNELTSKGES